LIYSIADKLYLPIHNGHNLEVSSTAKSLARRAKNQFIILNQFTRQWRREYLLGLREHYQCKSNKQQNTSPIKTGDIVVMKDDHTTQYWWKLGRVIELVKERDDQVRGARVQVFNN